MYILALLLSLAFISIPLIGKKKHSIYLSEVLIFSGFSGKILHSKKRGLSRKIISKSNYLKISLLRQSILAISILFLTTFFSLLHLSNIVGCLLILIYTFFSSLLVGLTLNKYLPLK
ncbi:hypothetical protein [uncultured Clostridium sp.]|uniref:hypothetical protein n=1 Tax=uncultured Clostridium sp. TaxID=59620 RepID=UPI00262AB098|nr:hypothetical protein [uncultured Clostridium sp.]